MGKRIVTSIRLDEKLVQMAMVLGLNVSKVAENALKVAICDMEPKVIGVIPSELPGLRMTAKILMMNTGKFKPIDQVKVGDVVVSYNESTGKCEEAHIIDAGPLTQDKIISSFLTIVDNMGTRIEVLPQTKIYCRRDYSSNFEWMKAEDAREGYYTLNVSGYYRHSGPVGSTYIKEIEKSFSNGIFFKLEIYPNNTFFANCNKVRKLHFTEDILGASWGLPIRGYPGQIGRLIET